MGREFSVRYTIIVPAVLLIMLLGGITAALSLYFTARIADSTAETLSQSQSDRVVNHLTHFFGQAVSLLHQNADLFRIGAVTTEDRDQIHQLLLSETKFFSTASSVYFGNPDGGVVVGGREIGTDVYYIIETEDFKAGRFEKWRVDDNGNRVERLLELPDFDARKRPWYVNARNSGTLSWSELYVLFTGQDMSIAPSKPVYDKNGKFLGVIGVDIFVSAISKFLRALNTDTAGTIYLVDPSGLLVASSVDTATFLRNEDSNTYTRIKASDSDNALIAAISQNIESAYGDFRSLPGNVSLEVTFKSIGYHVRVNPIMDSRAPNWIIISIVPTDYFVKPLHVQENLFFVILIIATILVIGVLSAILTRRVINPLVKLSADASAISTGEFNFPIDVKRKDEIGDLGRSLARMSRRISGTFAEVRESENRYRTLNQLLPVGVIVLNAQQMVTSANNVALRILSTSSEKLLGLHMSELVFHVIRADGSECPTHERPILATFITNKPQRNVIIGITSNNGALTWISVNTEPVFDDDGKSLTGAIACFSDITEQRQVELERAAATAEALNASNLQRLALRAAKAGVIQFDVKRNHLTWDERSREIFGVSDPQFDLNIDSWSKMIHPDDLVATQNIFRNNLKLHQDIDTHYRICWPNGEVRNVWAVAYIARDPTGKPMHLTVVHFDETERVRSINALLAAKEEAEKGNASKSEFLATMSHELRTPLNAIIGFAELMTGPLATNLTDEKRTEYIKTIQISGHHLLTLINDILDLSRIESKNIEMEVQVVKPITMINDVLRMMSSLSKRKSITIDTVITTSANIICDRRAMQQCLTNLLSNAIKFSDEGQKVTISVSNHDDNVCIAVSDNGKGIDKDVLSRIGESFIRSNKAVVASEEGSGLGLAIISRLIKLQNGTMEVDSTQGKGTTVRLLVMRAPDSVL